MANAVQLKLPDLWTDNIEAWFCQAESQFALRNITSDNTRYNLVVTSIDSNTAKRLNNILCNPPSSEKYRSIKEKLLSKFGRTPFERAAAIYEIKDLGDYKPSELMDHMLAILGNYEPDLLFCYHFFQCLPDYVRATLAYSPTTDPTALAEEADRIFIAGRPRDSVTSHMVNQADVDAVNRRSRGPARGSNQKRSFTKRDSTSSLCFYHARFGEDARRCREPCSWPAGNESRGAQQ